MRVNSSTRFAAMAVMVGALACAGNKARMDTSQTAAARDTTSDTLGGRTQNPPGYRGMERDTSIARPTQRQASDTFLQKQGMGTPQDTMGYSGAERVDTTSRATARYNEQGRVDSTSFRKDSTGAAAPARDSTSAAVRDSSAKAAGDTTGYHPSH
jgi:hypothetical protein